MTDEEKGTFSRDEGCSGCGSLVYPPHGRVLHSIRPPLAMEACSIADVCDLPLSPIWRHLRWRKELGRPPPRPIPSVPKRREDSRIQATPEALAKSLFGGATKRPETPPPQKRR